MNKELIKAIKESRSLLPEGAMSNEGLYWVSPGGKLILVNTLNNKYSMGHEEYANKKWNCSLEDALHKGYIRVQAVSPKYLFISHAQIMVRPAQEAAMVGFFFNDDMTPTPYEKMMIERGNDHRNFKEGDNNEALEYTISGDTERAGDATRLSTWSNVGANNAVDAQSRQLIHPAYIRPGVSAFGDSTDYSFAKWIAERKE